MKCLIPGNMANIFVYHIFSYIYISVVILLQHFALPFSMIAWNIALLMLLLFYLIPLMNKNLLLAHIEKQIYLQQRHWSFAGNFLCNIAISSEQGEVLKFKGMTWVFIVKYQSLFRIINSNYMWPYCIFVYAFSKRYE